MNNELTTTLNYYDSNAESFFDSTIRVDMKNVYERFLPHVKKDGFIVDAGCGSARDAKFFKQKGFDVYAFDASSELAQKASLFLQQEVDVATFDSFSISQKADAIWCCASLLHVTRAELPHAIKNITRQLNVGGVLYVSFKYGENERHQNDRYFTDMNEDLLSQLFVEFNELTQIDQWLSSDNRPGRQNEQWINAIYKKLGTEA